MQKVKQQDIENLLSNIKESLIPAVGYCRFSSDMQREESIEAQQRFISEYAERNGYKIIDWYIDRAFSGKTDKRPSFIQLIDDVKKSNCTFKAVIVHKTDRFSRNSVDAIRYKDILQDNNVQLISTTEHIENTANGKLVYGIMSTINQYYIDNLGNEVMKGLKENAYNLKFNGGKPPLGYDIVDGKYVINEAEAIIVRKIFEMSAEGCGYNSIIREMQANGYLTKAKKPFGKNSLHSILKNERYKGVYIFNKCSRRSSQNTRNSHKYKDESEIIRIEDGCPAIISKDLWERANQSRKLTAPISTNAKHSYLLSGLLYCGECGAKMHGNHRNYRNGYNTYRCCRRTNSVFCSCKEIRTEIVEEFVINCLIEHFFSKGIIDIITSQINKEIKAILENDNEEIKSAKNALDGLKIARNNLIDTLEQTGYNKVLTDRLNSLEQQINIYEATITDYKQNKESIEVSRDTVQKLIERLKSFLKDPQYTEQNRLLLHSYIEKIEISNTTIKATFKVAFPFVANGINYEAKYKHSVVESIRTLSTQYQSVS